jgi:hypothetical protein
MVRQAHHERLEGLTMSGLGSHERVGEPPSVPQAQGRAADAAPRFFVCPRRYEQYHGVPPLHV